MAEAGTIGGERAVRTPWHCWAVGGVSLLAATAASLRQFQLTTAGAVGLREAGLTPVQAAYFLEMPAWAVAVGLAGVGSAAFGSLLILLRRHWAFPVFALSFLALVVNYVYVLGDPRPGAFGVAGLAKNALVCAASLFMLWYSRTMSLQGVLR